MIRDYPGGNRGCEVRRNGAEREKLIGAPCMRRQGSILGPYGVRKAWSHAAFSLISWIDAMGTLISSASS